MSKIEIFVFGNPLVKEDSAALRIIKKMKIKGVKFVETDSLIDHAKDKESLIIMDVVDGIKNAEIIDIDKIEDIKPLSMHDFDLALEIKLIKKIFPERTIKILGIPNISNEKSQLAKIKRIINAIKKTTEKRKKEDKNNSRS
ncbi:MAG: hypothetical protein N3D73_02300 [Candidatus Diapherotrites archaeon]|nr:hypothetical protein [Candidatus Diapherotrites archaeon]